MKTISEQQIQDILKKAPQFTREEVVDGLKKKGYDIGDTSSPAAAPSQAPKPSLMDTIGGAVNKVKNMGVSQAAGSIFLGPVFGQAMQPLIQKAVETPAGQAIVNNAPGLVAGSTAQLISKPFVSMRAGVTGDYKPVQVPVAGAVRPFETPLSPASQYIAQGAGQKITPEEAAAAKKIGLTNLGEAAGTTIGAALEASTLGESSILKKPITKLAERIYQSALKPTVEAVEQGVVKTGLTERIWLTKGGVEKAAAKIDDLEAAIGKTIDAAKEQGVKVSTKGLKDFVDPIRSWFETVDVAGSKAAQEYIDTTLKDFAKKYGKNIPIEEAQKLKVNTMRYLRNSYGELSSVQKETQKQIARFLKEGIVEKAPVMGDINARLKNLYNLDQSLEKASRRIGNLNLLGLGAKIGGAAGGKGGALVGLAADLLDKAGIKSATAIGLNELAKMAGPGGQIPATALFNYILGRGQAPAENQGQ